MKRRHLVMGGAASLTLGACGAPSKFQRYTGPDVTAIVVEKKERRMFLLHKGQILDNYKVRLGFAPDGHKQYEGDGRTPEGVYRIDRRNPNSRYHLSLGISYPNSRDIAVANAMGLKPGGDIFIHGTPKEYVGEPDWTWGCIAVTNDEIEVIYAMVKNGTPIFIYP